MSHRGLYLTDPSLCWFGCGFLHRSPPCQPPMPRLLLGVPAANDTSYVYAMGSHVNGRTGLGLTAGYQETPAHVWRVVGPVAAVTAGDRSSAAIANGQLYMWGYNRNGMLGIGSTVQQAYPQHAAAVASARGVAIANSHALVLGALNPAECTRDDGCMCRAAVLLVVAPPPPPVPHVSALRSALRKRPQQLRNADRVP